ncbi:MAG: hypothetical protein LBR89_02760 [Holosporales bacterium]|jgi:hypothetical protein|nr:hypothetical protein [Holosporales bacterium]
MNISTLSKSIGFAITTSFMHAADIQGMHQTPSTYRILATNALDEQINTYVQNRVIQATIKSPWNVKPRVLSALDDIIRDGRPDEQFFLSMFDPNNSIQLKNALIDIRKKCCPLLCCCASTFDFVIDEICDGMESIKVNGQSLQEQINARINVAAERQNDEWDGLLLAFRCQFVEKIDRLRGEVIRLNLRGHGRLRALQMILPLVDVSNDSLYTLQMHISESLDQKFDRPIDPITKRVRSRSFGERAQSCMINDTSFLALNRP